jgi:hypothetical protein
LRRPEGIGVQTVNDVLPELADLPKPEQAAAEHATEFQVPL